MEDFALNRSAEAADADADSMSEDSLQPSLYHQHSPASSNDTDATTTGAAADRATVAAAAGAGATSSAAIAAAFTSAMVNDLAPHVFRVMVAPEGRQLITEVAGTCTASAVRSFVLSLRDCVFFVGATKGGHQSGGLVVMSSANAVRVVMAAMFIFWLLHLYYGASTVLTTAAETVIL
mmetsp:Transcript_12236/g.29559  ORF Transcript_12236/g.29559 Transcript_12236/m.29559 type:complete len:178 (-) Transcript_12236:299-832(-)